MGFQGFSVVFRGLFVLADHLVGYFLRFMMLFKALTTFVIGLSYNILNFNRCMYYYVALRLEFCC